MFEEHHHCQHSQSLQQAARSSLGFFLGCTKSCSVGLLSVLTQHSPPHLSPSIPQVLNTQIPSESPPAWNAAMRRTGKQPRLGLEPFPPHTPNPGAVVVTSVISRVPRGFRGAPEQRELSVAWEECSGRAAEVGFGEAWVAPALCSWLNTKPWLGLSRLQNSVVVPGVTSGACGSGGELAVSL